MQAPPKPQGEHGRSNHQSLHIPVSVLSVQTRGGLKMRITSARGRGFTFVGEAKLSSLLLHPLRHAHHLPQHALRVGAAPNSGLRQASHHCCCMHLEKAGQSLPGCRHEEWDASVHILGNTLSPALHGSASGAIGSHAKHSFAPILPHILQASPGYGCTSDISQN